MVDYESDGDVIYKQMYGFGLGTERQIIMYIMSTSSF